VEDIVVIDISDAADGFANDRTNVHDGVESGAFDFRNGDFATHHDGVAFHEGLASDAAGLVNREAGIEHGIGDRVADFIGMAFANGFGGKNVTA
jgi:hypothetical protein